MAIGLLDGLKTNYRGFLSVFGAFLVQLTAGSYHGTFGNLLPYFSSYFKQVRYFAFLWLLVNICFNFSELSRHHKWGPGLGLFHWRSCTGCQLYARWAVQTLLRKVEVTSVYKKNNRGLLRLSITLFEFQEDWSLFLFLGNVVALSLDVSCLR